ARNLAGERESLYERALCEDTFGLICLDGGQIERAREALEQACRWLELTAGGRDLARARLHLALTRLRAGESEPASELARQALPLLPAGADDPLLAIEGARLAELLQLVAPVGPSWLAHVIASTEPRPLPEVAKPAIVLLPTTSAPRAIRCYTLGRADVEV